MSEPATNYVPIELHKRFHAQAGRVWLGTLIVVFAWVSLTLAAPLFLSGGFAAASTPVYTFFSYICHQIPERSLYLAGNQLAVCSRCFGVYLGLLIGILVYPLWRPVDEIEPIPRYWLFLSLIPITVDWSLTIFGVWENTHLTRFITGVVLGAVCATFIVPALVEIVRNIAYRRTLAQ
ncbi:MAG: DUF2085 domain-containing protein [Pyrinomonadaceae bacterium]